MFSGALGTDVASNDPVCVCGIGIVSGTSKERLEGSFMYAAGGGDRWENCAPDDFGGVVAAGCGAGLTQSSRLPLSSTNHTQADQSKQSRFNAISLALIHSDSVFLEPCA